MQNLKEAPIGVFDSGVGGLTVAREIMRQIPAERIVYFGDTARVPYGSKSTDTLIRYTRQIIRFLKTRGVKAIVVACNTASAVALEAVRDELDIPIIGVVRPGAKVAVEATKNSKIGIIGTETTVNSGMYVKLIQELLPRAEVIGKACPLFVPLVEEGWTKDSVTEEVARRYLADLQKSEIDTLILGCTHYPLLRPIIQNVMGDSVTLIDSGAETISEVSTILDYFNLAELSKNKEVSERKFFTTGSTHMFNDIASQWLGNEALDIEHIKLGTEKI